jgi:hypothetical protein
MVENPLVVPELGSFPPNRFPFSVLRLLIAHPILDLRAPGFAYPAHICICPLCSWLPTSRVLLHIFSPFRNTPFLHNVFTMSHC